MVHGHQSQKENIDFRNTDVTTEEYTDRGKGDDVGFPEYTEVVDKDGTQCSLCQTNTQVTSY